MASWESVNCSTKSANTGMPSCISDYAQIDGFIAIPKGFVIPASALVNQSALEAYLAAKAIANNPADRFYLVYQFASFTPSNTDPQTQTAPNGRIRTTGVGFFGWDLEMWDNGSCANKLLLKYHLSQDRFDFINVHGGKTIAGVRRLDANGKVGMGGLKMMQVFTPNWVPADGGGTGTKYMIEFRLGDSEQMRELYAGKELDFTLSDAMAGLIDVVLEVEQQEDATYAITLTTDCGGENLTTLLGTELAVTAVWSATNGATGGVIPITTATLVSGNIELELNDANPNYPAPGGTIVFDLKDYTTLVANDIEGYEAIAASIVVAAS